MAGRNLVEHFAEKCEGEDVRLIHTGNRRPGLSPAAGQLEGGPHDAPGTPAGHEQGVGREIIVQHDAALRCEQPLGLLTQDHQIDPRRIGERAGTPARLHGRMPA